METLTTFMMLFIMDTTSSQEYEQYCVKNYETYSVCRKYENIKHYIDKDCIINPRGYCDYVESLITNN